MESWVHLVAGVLLVMISTRRGPFGYVDSEAFVAFQTRFGLAGKIIGALVIAFSIAELIGLDPSTH